MKEVGIDSVFGVMKMVTEYLHRAQDAARGEGSTLLDYSAIMAAVDDLHPDQMRILLWTIMPRFLQAAVELEQTAAHLARSAELLRLGYPPVGVPPVTADVDYEEREDGSLGVKIKDPTDGAEPTDIGCNILRNSKGVEYLLLRFWREDVGEWIREWLWSSLEDDSYTTMPKGMSFYLEHEFDLDDSTPIRFKSRGFRKEDGELQLSWDGGICFFSRVLPVSLRDHLESLWSSSLENPDTKGDYVTVTMLIDGPWQHNVEEDDHE